ncbi:MAG: Crp/Fnr family transcriptional regulator [Sphingobium sp.]
MLFDNFLKDRRRDQLSADDLAMLESLAGPIRTVAPRTTVVHQGETVSNSTYLLSGFMCRYMDDRKGERQFIAIHLPGDFVDLHGYPLKRLDHDLATITECTLVAMPHDRIDDIMLRRPAMARLLWFSTLIDAAMHREWIFRLGRLDALSRLGHFLCETERRLRAIGLSDGRSFPLPMTQSDLAEACGLTPVHINRMLRELRERGLATVQGGVVTMPDRAELARLSQFDPGYLFFDSDDPRNP